MHPLPLGHRVIIGTRLAGGLRGGGLWVGARMGGWAAVLFCASLPLRWMSAVCGLIDMIAWPVWLAGWRPCATSPLHLHVAGLRVPAPAMPSADAFHNKSSSKHQHHANIRHPSCLRLKKVSKNAETGPLETGPGIIPRS